MPTAWLTPPNWLRRTSRGSNPSREVEPILTAAQRWLPIQSIVHGVCTRADGVLVGGLLIHPLNLSLMSLAEQHQIVTQFRAAVDRLTAPWQMVSTYRPVDLSAYRSILTTQGDRLPPGSTRRQVLEEYQRWVLAQAQGDAVERIHALVAQRRAGKGALGELQTIVHGLHQDLAQIDGLHTAILDDPDWIRLIPLFFADHAGSSNDSLVGRLPPIYDAPERMDDHA